MKPVDSAKSTGSTGNVLLAGIQSVPGTADTRTPPRRPCRISGCRATVPHSPGYWPDGTCWRHHNRIAPALHDTKRVSALREEEQSLPPAQRRTQRELAELAGVSQSAAAIRPRSTPERMYSGRDLVDPLPPEIAGQIEGTGRG